MRSLFTTALYALALLSAAPALAQVSSQTAVPPAEATAETEVAPERGYRLGAYADLDLGLMLAMKQAAGISGGVSWGPFRFGLSYATFLSNSAFGGVPDGFQLRVNYLLGLNASYFVLNDTDEGFYVQAMFHIKQQGVTNTETGDHRDLHSLATGLELGYLWKIWRGLYVAPRVGALYYLKRPQGSDNEPVQIGGRDYDNGRHKTWDTYFIPTVSVGYAW